MWLPPYSIKPQQRLRTPENIDSSLSCHDRERRKSSSTVLQRRGKKWELELSLLPDEFPFFQHSRLLAPRYSEHLYAWVLCYLGEDGFLFCLVTCVTFAFRKLKHYFSVYSLCVRESSAHTQAGCQWMRLWGCYCPITAEGYLQWGMRSSCGCCSCNQKRHLVHTWEFLQQTIFVNSS